MEVFAFSLTTYLAFVSAVYAAHILPRARYTKNGGMRFLRVGRLQLSFCICKKSI